VRKTLKGQLASHLDKTSPQTCPVLLASLDFKHVLPAEALADIRGANSPGMLLLLLALVLAVDAEFTVVVPARSFSGVLPLSLSITACIPESSKISSCPLATFASGNPAHSTEHRGMPFLVASRNSVSTTEKVKKSMV